MQDPVRVGPFGEKDHVRVVIETPAGSRTTYKWDEDARAYRAGRVLPLGMAFPFDFGFIPGTKAEDGDALDAIVIADAPLVVGAADIGRQLEQELEGFFETYGREYKVIGTAGSRKALQLVKEAKR